jgi:hypothetical protein
VDDRDHPLARVYGRKSPPHFYNLELPTTHQARRDFAHRADQGGGIGCAVERTEAHPDGALGKGSDRVVGPWCAMQPGTHRDAVRLVEKTAVTAAA